METSEHNICVMRAVNPKSKIYEFTELMKALIKDKKFAQMLELNCAQFDFISCDIEKIVYIEKGLQVVKPAALLCRSCF